MVYPSYDVLRFAPYHLKPCGLSCAAVVDEAKREWNSGNILSFLSCGNNPLLRQKA